MDLNEVLRDCKVYPGNTLPLGFRSFHRSGRSICKNVVIEGSRIINSGTPIQEKSVRLYTHPLECYKHAKQEMNMLEFPNFF